MSVECFVTGGSGFIGQHLLARLTATGHTVRVLMRHPENLARLREKVGRLGASLQAYRQLPAISAQKALGSAKPTANACRLPQWCSTSRRTSPGGFPWNMPVS